MIWPAVHFPGPGRVQAPDFKATTLDGETVRLSDYAGKKNVLLVFGSATCPMTAASIGQINELYDRFRGDEIEFVFIYVREAHPGEVIPAHKSMREKTEAARLLRDEEDMHMPIIVDDLRGSIHRKYSKLPNPAFLIDKSGRVAFLSLWSKPAGLGQAIQELLETQEERGVHHAVVMAARTLICPCLTARCMRIVRWSAAEKIIERFSPGHGIAGPRCHDGFAYRASLAR